MTQRVEEAAHCISCGVRHGLGVGCGVPLHETQAYREWVIANPPVPEVLARLEEKVDALALRWDLAQIAGSPSAQRLEAMLGVALKRLERLETALKRQGVGAWAGLA